MSYSAKDSWTKTFKNRYLPYPPESLIRILRGTFPRMNLDKTAFANSNILDISCGEGRNIPLFITCGFKPDSVFATEIADEIVESARGHVASFGVPADNIRTGVNHSLPFPDKYFDYVVSWNECYYMQTHNFEEYAAEFARVCKPNATFIFSIPKKSCFIFRNAEALPDGYCIIMDDYFKAREGERMRIFSGEDDIQRSFSQYFSDFSFASIHDDFFGLEYHWHIGACKRKA